MAGCECEIWRFNQEDGLIKPYEREEDMPENAWILSPNWVIEYCPWCGTHLTAPEDTDD